jgi:PleD family two-component response regulator
MQVSTNGSIIAPSASLGWTPLASAKAGVSALKRGANDYVMFPVLPLELEARIHMQVALRRAVRLKADASR